MNEDAANQWHVLCLHFHASILNATVFFIFYLNEIRNFAVAEQPHDAQYLLEVFLILTRKKLAKVTHTTCTSY